MGLRRRRHARCRQPLGNSAPCGSALMRESRANMQNVLAPGFTFLDLHQNVFDSTPRVGRCHRSLRVTTRAIEGARTGSRRQHAQKAEWVLTRDPVDGDDSPIHAAARARDSSERPRRGQTGWEFFAGAEAETAQRVAGRGRRARWGQSACGSGELRTPGRERP